MPQSRVFGNHRSQSFPPNSREQLSDEQTRQLNINQLNCPVWSAAFVHLLEYTNSLTHTEHITSRLLWAVIQNCLLSFLSCFVFLFWKDFVLLNKLEMAGKFQLCSCSFQVKIQYWRHFLVFVVVDHSSLLITSEFGGKNGILSSFAIIEIWTETKLRIVKQLYILPIAFIFQRIYITAK